MSSSEKSSFYEFVNLPDDLLPAHHEVLNFAGRYVNDNGQAEQGLGSFDWGAFKSAIDDYKGDDLTIEGFTNTVTPLQDSDARVPNLINKLMESLPGLLPSGVVDTTKLRDGLNASFQALAQPLEEDRPATQSLEREFRAIVSATNSSYAGYLLCAVVVVRAEADIETESSCFKTTTSKDLNAKVNVMELNVGSGFVDPSS